MEQVPAGIRGLSEQAWAIFPEASQVLKDKKMEKRLRLIAIDRWFSFCIIPLQSSRCQPNGNFDTAQCIEQVIEHLVSQTSHLLKFFTINSNFVSCKIVRKKSSYDFFIFPDQAWWLPSRLHRRPMFLLWWGEIMIFFSNFSIKFSLNRQSWQKPGDFDSMIVPLNMAGFVLECHREGEADLSRWCRKMNCSKILHGGSTYDEIKCNSGVIWVLDTSLMATTDPVKSFILSTGEHLSSNFSYFCSLIGPFPKITKLRDWYCQETRRLLQSGG